MNTLLVTFLALSQIPGAKPSLPTAKTSAIAAITVRPQSDVAGPTIRLADVAEISSSDKALAAQLGSIEIGAAPLVGLSRSLMRADVITRLRFNHIDPDKIEVVSAPMFSVSRGGADVPVAEVVEFATRTLNAARKDAADGLQIEALPIPYKWVVSPGKREMQAGPMRGSLDGNLVTLPVTLLVDGKPAKTVEVSFRLKRLIPVLVATHPLEAHAVVKAEDLSLTTQEVAPGTVAITDASLVIGMRTTRQLPAGAVISKNAVEGIPVLTFGAPVVVRVQVGNILVETSGVARSQGAVGDRVRIFVPKTNKEVTAIVVDAKTVRLEDNG